MGWDVSIHEEALRRCGLTVEDLVAKPYQSFREEAPNDPEQLIEQRFTRFQEERNRRIQLVMDAERCLQAELRIPKPPSVMNSNHLGRLIHHNEALRREEHRREEARLKKEEADRREKKLIEDTSFRREIERKRDELRGEIISCTNSERAVQRKLRDEAIATLRQKVMDPFDPEKLKAIEAHLKQIEKVRRLREAHLRISHEHEREKHESARQAREEIQQEQANRAQRRAQAEINKRQEFEVLRVMKEMERTRKHRRHQEQAEANFSRWRSQQHELQERLEQSYRCESLRGSRSLSASRERRRREVSNLSDKVSGSIERAFNHRDIIAQQLFKAREEKKDIEKRRLQERSKIQELSDRLRIEAANDDDRFRRFNNERHQRAIEETTKAVAKQIEVRADWAAQHQAAAHLIQFQPPR
jgi:hypothetical protein